MVIAGGIRDGDFRYCNQKCHQGGALMREAQLLPDVDVQERLTAIHQGPCPKCQRVGAIDVHTAHFVWSALVFTRWKSSPEVSCASCGQKAKIKALVGSALLGWWGFPWGLVVTPVQITRNAWGLARSKPSFTPSAQLEGIVRLKLAADLKRAQAGALKNA